MKYLDFPGYTVVRPLSEQGSKSVFLARNRNDKPVVIKVVENDPGQDETKVRRFERAMRLARDIRHDNLVPVIDGGITSEHRWIVSEYVEGTDLETIRNKTAEVKLSVFLSMIRKACRGVQYMHENKLIHRDIRPSNILISKDNKVKVTGFGLVKDTSSNSARLTVVGEVLTLPHYMSPEQCVCAQDVDQLSDVYSIGCVMYFLICKRPPFTHKNAFNIMMAHVKEQPPPVQMLADNCPEMLASLIMQMIDKKQEKRPQKLSDVHQALRVPELVNQAGKIKV